MKAKICRFLTLTLLICAIQNVSFAQTSPPERIRILILGTFHFGETGDAKKTAFPDLMTDKRQKEITEIVESLAKFKPDKIFVENEPDRQDFWNQILTDYKKGVLKEKPRNEIFQIGVKLADKLKQNQVYCIDDQTNQLDYGKIQEFEEKHKDDKSPELNSEFFNLEYPFKRQKSAPKLADVSLSDYLLFLNSPDQMLRSSYDYTHYAIGDGIGKDYTGTDLTATWYKRNLYIFTNILRKTNKRDKVYMLLIGSAHAYILKHLFESNPHFEVVSVNDVLGAKSAKLRKK
ncbi:MAG: DUF5694 domain-containing protein [Pyrinomonadaceae bacterium]